jgi:hypothetical protein
MQRVNGVQKQIPAEESLPVPGAVVDETSELPANLLKKLKAPLPVEAVSPNPERPGLSVIKVIYIVERLNDIFGLNGWRVRNDVIEGGRMVVVKATLTVAKFGISIEQYGGNDNPDRGDAYKGACTDALSKCASYLGVGMDVYKGLYSPRLSDDAELKTTRGQTARHARVQQGPAGDGLTEGNMAGRFTALRGVLGDECYCELLARRGYREVVDIPNLGKGREVYRLLLGAFRERFAQLRRTLGQGMYEQVLRDLRLRPTARLTPEQAVRVYKSMEQAARIEQ